MKKIGKLLKSKRWKWTAGGVMCFVVAAMIFALSADNQAAAANSMDELNAAVKEADDKETLFKYTIYLDGEEVLSAVIAIIMDPEESSQSINLGINTYENKDDNDVVEYYISTFGIKLANVKFE